MRWLLALPLLLATTACGLPDEERSRTVDADVVPYNLLTTAEQEPGMGIRFVDDGSELLDRTVERLMLESLGPQLSSKLLAGRPKKR